MVNQRSITVGDTVSFQLGTTLTQGVVVDDRGPIGVGNVHIFRVRIPNDPYDDDEIEMPEDELSLDIGIVDSISKSEIVDYLEHGGLVQILKSNSSGGRTQPRVWLGQDSLGNVVHTFVPERGKVGGATVPFFALHNNRLFSPNVADISEFLLSFGLSKEDARQVIATVGTSR